MLRLNVLRNIKLKMNDVRVCICVFLSDSTVRHVSCGPFRRICVKGEVQLTLELNQRRL